MFLFRVLLIFCLFLFSLPTLAENAMPLPADQAFAVTGFLDQDNQLILQWDIAPDYYLYQDKFSFQPTANNHVSFSDPVLPKGQDNHDDLHGKFISYVGTMVVKIPLPTSTGNLALMINYQGCSTQGFCYPPMRQLLQVDLSQVAGPRDLSAYLTTADSFPATTTEQGAITQMLTGKHYFFILGSFLILGLFLAFTPCVLPMVPILSSIIIGLNQDRQTLKGFMLSLCYVLGMALAYALAGMVVALLGSSVQVALQAPWVIMLFSGLFVLLALSLFGFYELQLPPRLQQKIVGWSAQHKGGTYLGVFIMGAVATLVVSPCVSAPLVGVLTYIAQSGNVVLGGAALLMLGLGMGIPLLLVGASAGKLLPKSGAWMEKVKQFFGLMMLGMAILMLARIMPLRLTLICWLLLTLGGASMVNATASQIPRRRYLTRALAMVLVLYAGLLGVGVWQGAFDPLAPLTAWQNAPTVTRQSFVNVGNDAELADHLAQAAQHHQPVLLDFYAAWCGSCVAMDRHVFNRAHVIQALQHYVLLRIDVTHKTEFNQRMMRRFAVIAPPAMIFYSASGQQVTLAGIVGEVNEKKFLTNLKRVPAE